MLGLLLLGIASCNGEIGYETIDEEPIDEIKSPKVIYKYDDLGNRAYQYLVSESGDTIHTILYKDDSIVFNEGRYVSATFNIDQPENHKVAIDMYSVDIDSLKRIVMIRQFMGDSIGYKIIHHEAIDTSHYYFEYTFTENVVDIMVGVEYGIDSALIQGYLEPVIITLGDKPSIVTK